MNAMLNVNPIPWGVLVLAGGVLGGLALYGHAYHAGKTACETAAKVQLNAHLSRAIAQFNKQNAEDALILRAAGDTQRAIRTQTQTITKKVAQHVEQNPVYKYCELDACGLCLARSAVSGDDFAACPCEFDTALPGAATAANPDAWGFARDLYRDGRDVPGVPRAASGAGRLDKSRYGESE